MNDMKKKLNVFKLMIILFSVNFVFNFFSFRVLAVDIKEMESKSDYELYNIASEYFNRGNDQQAFKVVKYLLENKIY